MTISQQATRQNAVIAALKNITVANGFQTDVQRVLRGVRSLEDFSGSLPGLSVFKPVNENALNDYGGTESGMNLNILGFAKVEARVDDYTGLDKLAADTEKLLMSYDYNAYLTDTFIQRTYFYEGGVQDSFGFFRMELIIKFDHSFEEI